MMAQMYSMKRSSARKMSKQCSLILVQKVSSPMRYDQNLVLSSCACNVLHVHLA